MFKYQIILHHGLMAGFSLAVAGCTTTVDTSPSCIQLDMQVNEKAIYQFSENSITDQVEVVVESESTEAYQVNIVEGESQVSIGIIKQCQDDQMTGQDLSPKVQFIVYGSNFIPTESGSNDPPPPIEWQVDCTDQPQLMTVMAGTFSVFKCASQPATGSNTNIVKVTRFFKNNNDGLGKRPFSGNIKQIIDYQDSTQDVVELIEWNGL